MLTSSGDSTRANVAECVLGVFAFSDEGRMLGYRRFPDSPADIAGRIISIQTGTPTEEHRELMRDLIRNGITEVSLESGTIIDALSKEFGRLKFRHETPNIAGNILREKIGEIAGEVGCAEYERLAREVGVIMSGMRLRAESGKRDRLVVQAINIIDELDKFSNILIGQLREWYSIHFPELDRLVPDHESYIKLVLELGTRERFRADEIKMLLNLAADRAEKIEGAAMGSLGGVFREGDVRMVRRCMEELLRLQALRKELTEYIDGLMEEVAPNLRTVAGGAIGARLISLAGGLQELAKLPASTIQILGAEKALFRALKSRGKPPKHGVIYQYPDIRSAPKKKRGKIARALAGKIAIAARVDAMGGEFIGEKLASELRARIAEIKSRD